MWQTEKSPIWITCIPCKILFNFLPYSEAVQSHVRSIIPCNLDNNKTLDKYSDSNKTVVDNYSVRLQKELNEEFDINNRPTEFSPLLLI